MGSATASVPGHPGLKAQCWLGSSHLELGGDSVSDSFRPSAESRSIPGTGSVRYGASREAPLWGSRGGRRGRGVQREPCAEQGETCTYRAGRRRCSRELPPGVSLWLPEGLGAHRAPWAHQETWGFFCGPREAFPAVAGKELRGSQGDKDSDVGGQELCGCGRVKSWHEASRPSARAHCMCDTLWAQTGRPSSQVSPGRPQNLPDVGVGLG